MKLNSIILFLISKQNQQVFVLRLWFFVKLYCTFNLNREKYKKKNYHYPSLLYLSVSYWVPSTTPSTSRRFNNLFSSTHFTSHFIHMLLNKMPTNNKIIIHHLKMLRVLYLRIQLYLCCFWSLNLLLLLCFLVFLVGGKGDLLVVMLWGYCGGLGLFLLSYLISIFCCVYCYYFNWVMVFCKIMLSMMFSWLGNNILLLLFLFQNLLLFISVFLISIVLFLFTFFINYWFFFFLLIFDFLLLFICIIQYLVDLSSIEHKLWDHLMIRYIFGKKIVIKRINVLKYSFLLV